MAGHKASKVTVEGTTTISGAVTATNLDIRDLSSASDSVAVTDGGGALTVDGAVTASATDLDIRDLTNASDSVAIYGYNGTANVIPRIDRATNVWDTIDYVHHEVHSGSSFTCHFNNEVTNTGEMTGIAFNTPNTTKWMHLIAHAYASGSSYFAAYEASDLDVDEGTDLAIYNRNRNSAAASTVSSVETSPEAGKATSYLEAQLSGATLDTTTEIMRKYIGSSGKSDYGGEASHADEFVLKQNTQYCFVLVSLTDDTITHNITLDWYEHTDL